MSLVRHFLSLNASLAVVLAYGIAVSAQPQTSSQFLESTDWLEEGNEAVSVSPNANLLPDEPLVDQLREVQPEKGKSAQSLPQFPPIDDSIEEFVDPSRQPPALQETPQTIEESALERFQSTEPFNPGGNPLLFPTKPEEVKVVDVGELVTLEQVIELAIRNNRDLQNARLQLEESRAAFREQRAALYPSLDTDAAFARTQPATSFSDINGEPQQVDARTTVFGNLSLIYNIYTGGERDASIRRAERGLRRQEIQVEIIAEDTRFEATDRYYELQRADAQVAIAEATVEDTTQTLRDADLLEQAGLGTRFDVLRANADLAEAEQALTLAISQQRIARRQLAETLSLGQNVELKAKDEIEAEEEWGFSLEKSVVKAYKNRGELEQFLLDKEIAEQERLVALAGIKPQVDFLAQFSYSDDFEDTLPIETGYNFQTRVRWQFFDGGRAFSSARQADRRMDQADTNFANQRNEIRFGVEQAYYNMIANRENIKSTRITVISREEQLRLARLRFQAGVGTQTEVIDAQRDLAQSRVNFLNAMVDYNQSLNALQRAVSNLPTGRLFDLETQP